MRSANLIQGNSLCKSKSDFFKKVFLVQTNSQPRIHASFIVAVKAEGTGLYHNSFKINDEWYFE